MAKKWRDLVEPLHADPVRKARMDIYGRAGDVALALGALLDQPPTDDTSACADFIPCVGSPESDNPEDLFLWMLSEQVALLGGRLELRAVLPDRTVDLLAPCPAPASDDE